VGIAALALHAGHWVVATGSGVGASVLTKVEYGVNIGAEVTFIVLICAALGRLAYALWMLVRHAPAADAAPNGA
jgi:hypothetical protein